ncbi:hypothetical protein J1N35_035742 [Gossypium stocksii]|uniref:Myb/SANT-like domain-containing protein n=1 Tax=Gossypium stocksii TaxID=47602 RepID=A0A9D3UUK0_9ROSI|nr:hypothetical protein J1N35_035742 [Gossypium stocksii]
MCVPMRNPEVIGSTLATKAVWDDELTLTFCELCMNEVNAGNRPTTHLNSKGWENVVALFQAKTQKNYGKPQLKNKWDTLKKEWRLWRELLKESTDIGWCSSKKTVDTSEEWWAEKIQFSENPDFKGFKKKGVEPRLNELMWQMFGGIVATRENAWAPSSGVLPSEVPMGDNTHNEGFGDSDEHNNENEGIPPNEQHPHFSSNHTINHLHHKLLRIIIVMDEFNNMYNKFDMNYDTSELSEEAQRRIATIVTQVEHNNYREEEEYLLSSVLVQHETYFIMQPCMNSNYTGQMWVDEVLNGHDDHCMNSFRMPKNIFHSLLHDLQTNYGLKHGKVSAMEKLALLLYILGNRESNSNAAERFQRYGETVSKIYTIFIFLKYKLFLAFISLLVFILKDCIGAIDGTHIKACISPSCQIPYIGRKGEPTQNIMAVCDFSMCFIFAFPGWEGTVHDSRILLQALRKQELKFPHPPPGKYYLVDSGYPQMAGFLGPYRGNDIIYLIFIELLLNPNTYSTIVSNLTATVSNFIPTVTNLTTTAVFNLTRATIVKWKNSSQVPKYFRPLHFNPVPPIVVRLCQSNMR